MSRSLKKRTAERRPLRSAVLAEAERLLDISSAAASVVIIEVKSAPTSPL